MKEEIYKVECMELKQWIQQIDENRMRIHKYRPLSPAEVQELNAYYRIGTTYASNIATIRYLSQVLSIYRLLRKKFSQK